MSAWNSQRFLRAGRQSGVHDAILKSAVAVATQTLTVNSPGPPILTLGHLGHYTGLGVKYLRGLVARDGEDSYREFTIRKRPIQGQPPRFRFIAVPEPKLMVLQRWIATEILKHAPCHVASVAFAPDGNRIVAGSWDNKVRMWDAKTGEFIAELKGHTARVSCVAVTPDGTRVVSGSDDNTVRIWDIENAVEVKQLKGHVDDATILNAITSVAVSQDGFLIVAGSRDGTAMVWNAVTNEQVALKGQIE